MCTTVMQIVMDIKNELSKPSKNEQMTSTEYNNYMESTARHFEECPNSNPIDLSRRRDSVETRKTPSPSDSSMFGSSSPSIVNDSPSTASLNINNINSGSRSVGGGSNIAGNAVRSSSRARSDTPTRHYQSSPYMQPFRHSPAAFYPYQSKREESPSPPDTLANAIHHRHMHDYSAVAAQTTVGDLNPYILQAVALHQHKMVQSQVQERPLSNDSSTAATNNGIPAAVPSSSTAFPMVMGRDGKLSRPFKAYPRDPLTITATLTAADSIQASNEKYTAFRKHLLEQMHAANGGHPTTTNPKMRRTSAKSFSDNIASSIADVDQQEQQRERERECELSMQQHQQESQNAMSDSSSNGGGGLSNSSMHKDSAYFERRKKNNAAAKKSRDRRRMKEDEIAIRAAYLERENFELRCELEATKRQLGQFISQSMA